MSKISIRKIASSIKFANQGLRSFFKDDPKSWLHITAAILVVILGFILEVTRMEWLILVLCIGLVFAAEIFNSAIEKLCNKVEPNIDPQIKIIKDLAAAAVWTLSLTAAIIGCIIFWGKIA
ncbi:diacylglycerol kinase family protein [Crocinitomix catalasitica]|uniref:diacylglycerol kinase family protein n=1 Tax=Crocinitomix catalasitica TaxID=184607 RepID=UPI00047FCEE7|nr:diacylglycerol kinase family protein [Crocinitomix catalasitica]